MHQVGEVYTDEKLGDGEWVVVSVTGAFAGPVECIKFRRLLPGSNEIDESIGVKTAFVAICAPDYPDKPKPTRTIDLPQVEESQPLSVTSDEMAEMLKGKTIAKVEHGKYLDWEMTIQEIGFTDGSRLMLGGNADEAHFETYYEPGGNIIWVKG